MSVYTQLTEQEFRDFLSLYDEGELVNWQGIEAGIENTNYFVNTRHPAKGDQQFVLTIFEYLPKEKLPFFIRFMELLAKSGLPVPAPVHGRDDLSLKELKGKPCMLQPRLDGNHIEADDLTVEQCRLIGDSLARVHVAGQKASFTQDNFRGMDWIGMQVSRLSTLLPEDERKLQAEQWQAITAEFNDETDLPRGLIHADLFVDNVLFHKGKVSGIIDFFQSCEDWLLYDVAVTVNDWCLKSGSLELAPQRTEALLQAYAAVRPFTDEEHRLWPLIHRLACLRFWISRAITYTYPDHVLDSSDPHDDSVLRHFKDPAKFRDMLRLRTANSSSLVLP
ncbi:homoserine kinase [Parendozoicomonas haliclonae]|uniref:Homoserine kinase n=1 Tax=Parendozoicomonas haliclonae TaxID=1960125 RepID=A0A1X7AJ60_9GAMM|nr:homoserine kinase [Parendozoicomonas haliclonae]SMA46241.1 Homoserine kinase [Parendozoicomonas haliclonae]